MKITKFFEELLLEHGGAYTLLGSKPATVEGLIDMSPESRKLLEEYLASHPEIPTIEVERYLEEGWDVFKKNKNPISDKFILTEIQHENHTLLVFLNTKLSLESMRTHHSEFERVIGPDFDPQIAIDHLRQGKHGQWRSIFSDFICTGILLGYGVENARKFQENFAKSAQGTATTEYLPSENNDPRIRADSLLNEVPFRIPIFVMFDTQESEELVRKYKNERERIQALYAGKDFLNQTLHVLSSGQAS